ncbi:methyl-accepting chemotaxis protein [Lysinibacillus sp. BW-2-10]|uniref:methyl-accepting chemotaxis protein n=1 Tax=Lysinibacillus sp. BW-2-10 TaxID=2590030 RepID=UPI00117FE996|nr:methyl-accepting chemotaxis protein [Lysinibacillus sp. BW-2-10]TSI08311.1 methyl-accepting chemotaxis protein [Lysinibacillus sp. BW-2-10]
MKLKGIGAKLTTSIVALLLLTCGTLGIFSYINSSNAVIDQVKTNLQWKAGDISHYIEEYFKRTYVEIEAIAQQSVIQSMEMEDQLTYLNKQLEKSPDYLGFGIVAADGTTYYSDGSTSELGDRDYIQEAFQGKTVMSDTIISRVTNEPVVMIATPIETVTGEKALLLARMDGYYISSVIEEITIGKSGYAFIVNAEGTIQAHPNLQLVKEQVNFITVAENEDKASKMTGESLATKEMINNEEGIYQYSNSDGQKQIIGYHTLENGWKMGVMAVENEALSGLNELKQNFLITSIIIIGIGILFALFVTRSVSRPINHVVRISEHLAEGDFTHEISPKYLKRIDELGVLSRSLTKMVVSMREMIVHVEKSASDVNSASNEVMNDVMNVTSMTKNIARAIVEVERGAESNAVTAEESAMAMEQMAAGVAQVANVANNVSVNTEFIASKVHDGHEAVRNSMQHMNEIQKGMDIEIEVIRKLDKESKEIGLISSMISDISDQTNLLALNASIEAARAGEAGKGFAVVAEEVRKLSEQTAGSAMQINALIEKIQDYTGEAVKAAESGEVKIEQGLKSINTLGERFEEIVNSVEQIAHEIEELSSSAQQMSANTEEVTASMEEMSATAQSSKDYVHEVTTSTDSQLLSVEEMKRQTEQLSDMAKALQVAVSQFKL